MKMGWLIDRLAGVLLVCVTVLVICREWGVAATVVQVLPVLVLGVILLFAMQISRSRLVFVALAVALSVILALTNENWIDVILRGLGTAAFIAAFFSALSILRTVAASSPAIQQAGQFLSAQKPGRRYAALTVGGQLFALVLNYGAIQLLGTLAMVNARAEPNEEIRRHRIRRMLLAIQRAFISTLPWSPLSFAMVISTSVVPGASWSKAILPGLVTSAILAGTGWALDTIFKPRLAVTPVRSTPQGNWSVMLPLLWLLILLATTLVVLYELSGVRIVGLVTLVVPVIAVMWMVRQHWSEQPVQSTVSRLQAYLFTELPGYRSELTLLMMAGFIGTVGASVLAPLIRQAGVDTSVLPAWLVLVSFVWLIPLAGQAGMNPILAVTLLAPLIPNAGDLGVTPTALVVAITSGWALSGATSPFTATTLLIGWFANTSPSHVGLVWNGAYALICLLALSAWVVLFGFLL